MTCSSFPPKDISLYGFRPVFGEVLFKLFHLTELLCIPEQIPSRARIIHEQDFRHLPRTFPVPPPLRFFLTLAAYEDVSVSGK